MLRKCVFASVTVLALSATGLVGIDSAQAAVAPAPATIAQSVFAALNASRIKAKLPPLRWNAGLQRSSHAHNVTMSARNTLGHQLPGEAPFGSRITAQGVRWTYAAENIGWASQVNTTGALQIESVMLAEKAPNDGHRRNILSNQVNSIGIDIVLDTKHHRLWLTEDFAKI